MEDRAEVKEEADEIGEGESKTLWPIMTAQFIISSADPRLSKNHHHHHQFMPPDKRTDPNRQNCKIPATGSSPATPPPTNALVKPIKLQRPSTNQPIRATPQHTNLITFTSQTHSLQTRTSSYNFSPLDFDRITQRLHRPHGQSRADERSSLASLGPIIVLLIKLHAHHLPCLNKKKPLCLLISAFFYPSTSHHHPASIDTSTATDIL
ncbi:hypothetical protein PGT21_021252 [Puccinia graminis f. sp. tritici]|uniref:Uncharacterized protein n=1 Tax=Puccinia graminis f. sp. tritici TaxID=56615 RepID=A0A5B0P8F0_PUCGR|nr:hypothetical protein PGT21_021252 [Puccinia graminis f. sp. tritici]KAA1117214.1 hypothetical protein PGTUg99_037062 [Puccinia graminis f. sp. tritici]